MNSNTGGPGVGRQGGRRGWLAPAVLAVVMTAGCAQQPSREHAPAPGSAEQAQAPQGEGGERQKAGEEAPLYRSTPGEEAQGLETELYPGSGEFLDKEAARPRQEPVSEEGQISLNFEGTDIREIVKTVLGDILGLNYVIAPGVSGKATFATARPVTRDQVLPILEMLLSWNNAALVQSEGRWNVVPQNEAIPGNLVPRVGKPPKKGFEVRAVPLDYIAPTEMEKILKPFARANAIVSADNARGLLILAGTPAELSNYMQTIDIFDVNWLKGMSVGIFPLQRVEADKIVEELNGIFGTEGDTPLAGMFRFMPLERLNAVLAITPQPEYLKEARDWVQRLDRGTGQGAGTRLYVYDVKNVKAADLADTLNQVFGGSGRSRSERESAGALAPGLQPVEIRAINDQRSQDQDKQKQQQQQQQQQQGSGQGGLQVVDGEDISITAVEESNSLVIRATPAQYEAIQGAIDRLDVIPLQVHVEAKIVEVKLTDSLEYGVQWYFENAISSGNIPTPGSGGSNGDGSGGTAAKSIFDRDSQSGFFGASTGGLTYAFTGSDAQAVLNAISSATTLRVISAPSLMVLNNKEAHIQVGDQIPVVSTTFNAAGSNVSGISTTSSVQFRDTGVILTVTPRVNPGGLVFLEIKQELSEVSGKAGPTGNLPLSKRTIDTELAVQSGDTVLLGGLISDTRRSGNSGVPILKDLPLVGGLFGSKTSSGERRELLVLLTPQVVRDSDEAREVTREYRAKFKGLKPLDLEHYSVDKEGSEN